jgi:hypothetical protein
LVILIQVAAEGGGVVGIDDDEQALFEQFGEGVAGDV